MCGCEVGKHTASCPVSKREAERRRAAVAAALLMQRVERRLSDERSVFDAWEVQFA